MPITDVHTHSRFSADGVSPLADMVAAAKRKGVLYYGVSEHFDYDYREQGILACGKPIAFLDEAAYFACARALQAQEERDDFHLLVGGEFGFAALPRCHEAYARAIETHRPDFVVNSVHTCDGKDCYFTEYFEGKSRSLAYGRYLETVRASLDAPYPYDIVAHIGYVTRNAPYPDKALRYGEFPALLDEILRTVIAKGKILEVNSSARGSGSPFLPGEELLMRYRELGGTRVSFASDAHDVTRVAHNYADAAALLRSLGFSAVTVPCRGEEIVVPLA